jgi:hypothetical protein
VFVLLHRQELDWWDTPKNFEGLLTNVNLLPSLA